MASDCKVRLQNLPPLRTECDETVEQLLAPLKRLEVVLVRIAREANRKAKGVDFCASEKTKRKSGDSDVILSLAGYNDK